MLGTFLDHSETKRIVIDIETYDPNLTERGASYVYSRGYILGIGIKLDNLPAEYYPLHHKGEQNYEVDTVYRYISDISNNTVVCNHNLVYDVGWLKHECGWLHQGKFRDTMLKGQLDRNDRVSNSLAALAKVYNIGEKISIDTPKLYQMPIPMVASYCCNDVELTARLDDATWKLNDNAALQRECALIPILVKMKERGIRIDLDELDRVQMHYNQLLDEQIDICGIYEIWAAAKVVVLFDDLRLDYPRTKLNGPSFPKWFLETVDHPKVKALLKARHIDKLIQFCLGIREHLDGKHRIHPDFFNGKHEFGGTITGRFSSGHPNVQQQPNRTDEGRLLRSLFIPDDGHILYKFDYKQQEPMLWMYYADKLRLKGIDRWKEMYKSPDADFYTPIMESMNIKRFDAKTITLAVGYGMGHQKMSRMNHIELDKASSYLNRYKETVPWLIELRNYCRDLAAIRGYVHTIGGRNLYFDRKTANNAFNHLIQGSAADQTKQAMINVENSCGKIPLLQVHDELLYQLSEDDINECIETVIEDRMQMAISLDDFPVRVDSKPGLNWQQCG